MTIIMENARKCSQLSENTKNYPQILDTIRKYSEMAKTAESKKKNFTKLQD